MAELPSNSLPRTPSELPEHAVLLDRSNSEAAERSLRKIAEIDEKVIFCKAGSEFYAIKDGTGPGAVLSFFRRHAPSWVGMKQTYYANDKAGVELAKLFCHGMGESLQAQMNSSWTWARRALDAKVFAQRLDDDINSRAEKLLKYLSKMNLPRDEQGNVVPDGVPIVPDVTYGKCVAYVQDTFIRYHAQDTNDYSISYREAARRLRNLQRRYKMLIANSGWQDLMVAPNRLGNPLGHPGDDTLLTSGLLPRSQVTRSRQWGQTQDTSTEAGMRDRFQGCLKPDEVQEIIEAGLATNSSLIQTPSTPLGVQSYAHQLLRWARIGNDVRTLREEIRIQRQQDGSPKQDSALVRLGHHVESVKYLPNARMQLEELREIYHNLHSMESHAAEASDAVPNR